jgi:hypothetical protein
MADHRATWARLREVAWQRYPDDDRAAEAAARALFDPEEVSYAVDLDARAEEQGILDSARAATCLRGELREELRAEGSGASGTEEEYVHLDNDDLAYLKLPIDKEAVESAAKQRVLMVPFEMQRHDKAVRRLMAAERRAADDDLVAPHQSARQSAYLYNLGAVDKARAVAAGQRPQEDRARVEAERRLQAERARAAELARVCEHQYPVPSYYADARIAEDAQHHRQ